MALFKSKLTVSARYYMYATKKKKLENFFYNIYFCCGSRVETVHFSSSFLTHGDPLDSQT